VRVGDRLGHHIIGAQRAHQRHALRGCEHQIKAVHPALPERPAVRTVRCDAVIEPAGHRLGVGFSPGPLNIAQPDQTGDGAGVASE
jgi:hypothetical protein